MCFALLWCHLWQWSLWLCHHWQSWVGDHHCLMKPPRQGCNEECPPCPPNSPNLYQGSILQWYYHNRMVLLHIGALVQAGPYSQSTSGPQWTSVEERDLVYAQHPWHLSHGCRQPFLALFGKFLPNSLGTQKAAIQTTLRGGHSEIHHPTPSPSTNRTMVHVGCLVQAWLPKQPNKTAFCLSRHGCHCWHGCLCRQEGSRLPKATAWLAGRLEPYSVSCEPVSCDCELWP